MHGGRRLTSALTFHKCLAMHNKEEEDGEEGGGRGGEGKRPVSKARSNFDSNMSLPSPA